MITSGLFAGGNHHPNPQPTPTPPVQAPSNNTVNNYNCVTSDCCEYKTAVGGELALRLMDSKRMTLHVYDSYDARASHNHFLGARLTVKLGKSYEEKLIEEIQRIQLQLMAVAHAKGIHQEDYYRERPPYIYMNEKKKP